jgi:hypothetical protein
LPQRFVFAVEVGAYRGVSKLAIEVGDNREGSAGCGGNLVADS